MIFYILFYLLFYYYFMVFGPLYYIQHNIIPIVKQKGKLKFYYLNIRFAAIKEKFEINSTFLK